MIVVGAILLLASLVMPPLGGVTYVVRVVGIVLLVLGLLALIFGRVLHRPVGRRSHYW